MIYLHSVKIEICYSTEYKIRTKQLYRNKIYVDEHIKNDYIRIPS